MNLIHRFAIRNLTPLILRFAFRGRHVEVYWAATSIGDRAQHFFLPTAPFFLPFSFFVWLWYSITRYTPYIFFL